MLAQALRSCTRSQFCPRLQRYVSTSGGHNAGIIEMLKKERNAYSEQPGANGYKIRAFSNAIKVIEGLDKPIYSSTETLKLKGIGRKIANRIRSFLEIHATDHPPQYMDDTLRAIARAQFLQIPGLGRLKVDKLLDQGCTGIADLRSRKFRYLVTPTQRIHAKYFEHVEKPATREDAEIVVKFMQQNLPSNFDIVLAGDCRRGLPSFPHIDIVLSHSKHVQIPVPEVSPDSASPSPKLRSLKLTYIRLQDKESHPLHGYPVSVLTNRGLICDTLSSGDRIWRGIVRIPELVSKHGLDGEEPLVWRDRHERLDDIDAVKGTFRRVNIVLTPQKSRPVTLFMMTGDQEFVKYVRARASNLGLHLDEFGLWKWRSVESAESMEEQHTPAATEGQDPENTGGYWELLKVSTEKDIFSLLDMEYVEPHRRNFGYLETAKRR
ncbi:hypothetical protein F5887DRAFT_679795 [Amanita rubescens]|nr:hypothetical protein F5887DRAFT_679795 [Amanita rubescens]